MKLDGWKWDLLFWVLLVGFSLWLMPFDMWVFIFVGLPLAACLVFLPSILINGLGRREKND